MDEINELMESMNTKIAEFFKEFSEGPSFKDQLLAFAHAVDWTEPWIIGLLSLHVVLLVVALCTRRMETLQFVLFIAGVMFVWSAENLNALGAIHWKTFSQQNYFDKSGLFITVMFSGPLMVICIIILIQLMFTVVQTMYRWKRAELKHRARQAGKHAMKDKTS